MNDLIELNAIEKRTHTHTHAQNFSIKIVSMIKIESSCMFIEKKREKERTGVKEVFVSKIHD